MKRLFGVLLLAFVTVALLLPISATTAEAPAYREGIAVRLRDGWSWHVYHIDLHATKLVDEDYRSSTVELNFSGPVTRGYGRRDITAVFTVPIDPDYLEVSEDLGWGGLDAVVWVEQRTRWFDPARPPETRMVPVEIHLDLYHTARSSFYRDGFFYRQADVRGTITIDGYQFGFALPNDHFRRESGHNFTDQWPGL